MCSKSKAIPAGNFVSYPISRTWILYCAILDSPLFWDQFIKKRLIGTDADGHSNSITGIEPDIVPLLNQSALVSNDGNRDTHLFKCFQRFFLWNSFCLQQWGKACSAPISKDQQGCHSIKEWYRHYEEHDNNGRCYQHTPPHTEFSTDRKRSWGDETSARFNLQSS